MWIAQAEVWAGHKLKLDEDSEPNKPLTQRSLEGKRVFFSSLRLTSSQPSQSCFHSFCNIWLISIDFLGIHVFSSSFVSAVFELGNKFYILRDAEEGKGSRLFNNPGFSLVSGMGGSPPPVKYSLIWLQQVEKSLLPSQVLIVSRPKVTFPSPIDTNFQVISQ